MRDAENRAILCFHCNRAVAPNRPIVVCSVCGKNWHTDCLDPPLANPAPPRTWRCPAHVDDLLALVPGTAHKWRYIRGAPAIKSAYSRGSVNNGHIEVHYDLESEDESGWNDPKSFGRVQRVSAKGIMLDFLAQRRRPSPVVCPVGSAPQHQPTRAFAIGSCRAPPTSRTVSLSTAPRPPRTSLPSG